MNNELIERYIYAVTRHLKATIRKDVEAELRGLIFDMLEERCGDVMPSDRDVKVVLTELGTPFEMAVKYSGDDQKALISGVNYIRYKLILKIVLPIAVLGLSLAGLLNVFLGNADMWYFAFMQWLASIFTGLAIAFGFITFLFAVFERNGVNFDTDGALENLPPVPQKHERIKPWESVAGIVISVLFTVIFLACPQIVGGYFWDTGTWVPVFNADVIRSMWYIVIALALIGIAREIFKLSEGRYTKRFAAATVIANLITAAFFFLFFTNKDILNVRFFALMKDVFAGEMWFVTRLFENFHLYFMGLVIFALVLDSLVTAVNAFRYDN